MATLEQFNRELMHFVNASPTPYHAVAQAEALLSKAGFTLLDESATWQLKAGERYYLKRRDASLIAFVLGKSDIAQSGMRIIGAHTDSPCLKLKPMPFKRSHGYIRLAVEVYGGALLNPWFDRDLALAGRIAFEGSGEVQHQLIDSRDAIAVIPSLAIHLDRHANEKRSVNPQEHILPILTQNESIIDLDSLLRAITSSEDQSQFLGRVLDADLRFYDTQQASLVGLENEFICSARLDNLLSCFLGLSALLNYQGQESCAIVFNDHEEVGSQSDIGARSNFLNSVLDRLSDSIESRHRMLAASMLFSVDNAHGIHPNFPARHDEGHGPLINGGPVLKYDANQSYATSSESAAVVKLLAEKHGIPLQSYVTRSDMRCGSTIGPMTAAQTGVATVDLGVPTFGMHSIRETAGSRDAYHMYQLLSAFYGNH